MESKSKLNGIFLLAVFVAAFGLGWAHVSDKQRQKLKRTGELNDRPIIGILAPTSRSEGPEELRWIGSSSHQYLPASYVKFVESAGAQVVPVLSNLTEGQYSDLFHSLNGVLFPGGVVSLHSSGYLDAARTFYNLAVEANSKGDVFPIWGTCLGFQTLTVLAAGEDLLTKLDSENINMALNFTSDALTSSRLFAAMPTHLSEALSSKAITFNNHQYGITPQTLLGNAKLSSTFHMLSTSRDRQGKLFVSTMEGRSLPFYAIQWHTEKSTFEWNHNEVISHDPDAISVTQYMANFFVAEARRSSHQFPSYDAEQKALIYNWHTVHNPTSDFEEVYIW